jgi:hypothetical protein
MVWSMSCNKKCPFDCVPEHSSCNKNITMYDYIYQEFWVHVSPVVQFALFIEQTQSADIQLLQSKPYTSWKHLSICDGVLVLKCLQFNF